MNKEKMIYQLDNGTITTVRSSFIRQEFKKGKSRKAIVKILNDMGDKVSYGVVASATANMDNGTLQHRGRVFLEFEDGQKIPRVEYIRDQIINKKKTIKEVAEELGIKYDRVYAAYYNTPGVTVQRRGRITLELDDGTKIFRADYIRKRWAEGATRSQIAKECSCDYMSVHNTIFRRKKREANNE